MGPAVGIQKNWRVKEAIWRRSNSAALVRADCERTSLVTTIPDISKWRIENF